MSQLDLYRDSPQRLAAAYRVAADSALINPLEPKSDRERRAAHYLAEAERLERTHELYTGKSDCSPG